jgi:NAD(P)H-dependent FMN reductase
VRFVVVYGSVRGTRQGIKAARFVVRTLEARGHAVTLLDAMTLGLPLLDRMYKEYVPRETAPEPLRTIAGHLATADGFVIVSGEYNHGLPPGLTNLLDHFLEEWFWRPSAIVSYSQGQFGGVRAAMHLRAMLCELGMPSIPSIFPCPRVHDAFEDDGTPRDPKTATYFERFAAELEWYAGALAAARTHGTPY